MIKHEIDAPRKSRCEFRCAFAPVARHNVGHHSVRLQVRLQTQATPKPGEQPMYKGTWDCTKKIFAKEVSAIHIFQPPFQGKARFVFCLRMCVLRFKSLVCPGSTWFLQGNGCAHRGRHTHLRHEFLGLQPRQEVAAETPG